VKDACHAAQVSATMIEMSLVTTVLPYIMFLLFAHVFLFWGS
jgi:hypothetical protein